MSDKYDTDAFWPSRKSSHLPLPAGTGAVVVAGDAGGGSVGGATVVDGTIALVGGGGAGTATGAGCSVGVAWAWDECALAPVVRSPTPASPPSDASPVHPTSS